MVPKNEMKKGGEEGRKVKNLGKELQKGKRNCNFAPQNPRRDAGVVDRGGLENR